MTDTATLDISITLAQADAASKTLTVSVSAERVAAAEADQVRWYGAKVKLPGFRKGHAPAPVIRRRFGDAIRQAVLEDLVRESWQQARSEKDLKPIGDPQIRIVRFEAGQPLEFEMQVDVRPELTLARTGGFKLTRRAAAVTDDMVEAQLLQLREQRAPWAPADGRARPGDLVEATITNLDGGEEGTGEPVRFVLGQGRALPELEEQVMLLDPGGTWEGPVRFPDDHPDEAKRGTARRVRITLGEVKRQVLPELSDAFAGEVGSFASLDALRSAIRSDLEAEAAREADARVRAELIEQIAAANNVGVPPSLLSRAVHAYMHAYGVPEDQHERFHHEFAPVAEAQVRRDLIVEAVADERGLHATPAALEERVAAIAARRGESPAAVRAALEKAGRLREIERGITDENVFAHLLGQSTVDDAPTAR